MARGGTQTDMPSCSPRRAWRPRKSLASTEPADFQGPFSRDRQCRREFEIIAGRFSIALGVDGLLQHIASHLDDWNRIVFAAIIDGESIEEADAAHGAHARGQIV